MNYIRVLKIVVNQYEPKCKKYKLKIVLQKGYKYKAKPRPLKPNIPLLRKRLMEEKEFPLNEYKIAIRNKIKKRIRRKKRRVSINIRVIKMDIKEYQDKIDKLWENREEVIKEMESIHVNILGTKYGVSVSILHDLEKGIHTILRKDG